MRSSRRPTLIGAVADHRFIAAPSETDRIMRALAAALAPRHANAAAAHDSLPVWFGPLVEDLKRADRKALVHVGPEQPASIHALAYTVNDALDGRGSAFDLIEPVRYSAHDRGETLAELVEDMRGGRVTSLLIIDSNPAYTTPAALGFAKALERVPFSLALAPRADETARAATWFVPLAHPWEAWSDARAHDGSVTILQPQALPLYRGHSAHELLARFTLGHLTLQRGAGPRPLAGAMGRRFRAALGRSARDGLDRGQRRRRGRCAAARWCIRHAAGHQRRTAAGREREHAAAIVPAGPLALGWPLRQQSVAPGVAAAAD
jgi:hypothetical protein